MKFIRRREFTFCMHTCRLGNRMRKGTNPFTGAAVEFPIDDGLSMGERSALRAVFDTYGVEGPEPEFEGYALYLPGNGSVRLRGFPDLADAAAPAIGLSVEIVVEALSNDVLAFVLEVAREGNLALMSSTGKSVRLVTESKDPRVRMRWLDAALIATVADLRVWLEADVGSREVRSAVDDEVTDSE